MYFAYSAPPYARSRYLPPKKSVKLVIKSPKMFCSTRAAVPIVQGYRKEMPGTMVTYGEPFPVRVKGESGVQSGCSVAFRKVRATKDMKSDRVSGGMLILGGMMPDELRR
jgi:hypothetical protein